MKSSGVMERLWHIESKLTNGEPIVLSEYPVKYVVGSGRHSRTYLVETEGFLVESPITWYSERKQWGMSPGYDRANHLGFERATGQGCLECHAGRTAPLGKSLHRMEVVESAIGCERCHGPGSLHLEKHRGFELTTVQRSTTGTDFTIVNPAALSRELAGVDLPAMPLAEQCLNCRCADMVFLTSRPGCPCRNSDMITALKFPTLH